MLSWATVAGHRKGDNPARWKGNLSEILPKPTKVTKAAHQPALALSDAPELHGRSDAYVFTREAARAAGLKVVRTYRLVNPACGAPPLVRRNTSGGSRGQAGGLPGFA